MGLAAIARLFATAGSTLALCACGGGEAERVATIPAPPVAPPPTSAPVDKVGSIIASATPNQPFASMGGTVRSDAAGRDFASTAAADQSKIRYDSVTGQYQITVPGGSAWETLYYNPFTAVYGTQTASSPYMRFPESAATGYQYSALATLFLGPSPSGVYAAGNAYGIATPSGAVPTMGSATYKGTIAGFTTETVSDWGAWGAAQVEGGINLSFDFGAGTLGGAINPSIRNGTQPYALQPLNFLNTVFGAGSTSFSGQFATSLSGANGFSGQFTGPAAQELIGNFEFPYTSKDDGKAYQATGGFVAKQ